MGLDRADLLKEAALFSADFLFWQGRVSAAVARYEEVLGDLEEFPEEEPVLRACTTLGWCYGICGQTARGLGLIEAVRQKASARGFKQAEMDSYVMGMLALIDAGYLAKAEAFLQEVFKFPEEELGNYRLWASYAAWGHVQLYTKGDLAACFRYQHLAYAKSKEIGWPHHRGPHNFDYMDALEEAGMVHPEMNYDSELKRVAGWPDIYMQGVGLRFAAQRLRKRGRPREEGKELIRRSQDLHVHAGARLELARTQLQLAGLALEEGEEAAARRLLRGAGRCWRPPTRSSSPTPCAPIWRPSRPRSGSPGDDRPGQRGGHGPRPQEPPGTGHQPPDEADPGRPGRLFRGRPRRPPPAQRQPQPGPGPGGLARLPPQPGAGAGGLSRRRGPARPPPGQRPGQPAPRPALAGLGALPPGEPPGPAPGGHLPGQQPGGDDPPAQVLTFLDLLINQVAVALDNARAYEEVNASRNGWRTRPGSTAPSCSARPTRARWWAVPAMARVVDQIRKVAPSDITVRSAGRPGWARNGGPGHPRPEPPPGGALHPGGHRLPGPRGGGQRTLRPREGRLHRRHPAPPGPLRAGRPGTLFLDDVDNLSPEVQAKLLRALQERSSSGWGATRPSAPTSADRRHQPGPGDPGRPGELRADLFFRLNVFPILVPPLRQRGDDIPLLAGYFMEKFAAKAGKELKGIAQKDLQRLRDYPWPGNVRELKHVVERGVILSEGETLLVPDLADGRSREWPEAEFASLVEMERKHIVAALGRCGWRVSGKGGAAERLGLKPTTLYSKMKKLGIGRTIRYA